jgi:voltage-gated potassium channel
MAEDEQTPTTTGSTGTDGDIGYEIFMAGLSILSIVNLVIALVVQDEALGQVITVMNLLLTVIFMIDFVYRFAKAPSKKAYLIHGYGWADFLSAMPFQQTNVLRLFRLIRVYRLLSEYGVKRVLSSLVKDRAESALLMLLLIGMLVLEFGSLQMLRLEQGVAGANITTASDALWYVIVTMATVGYGDEYPTTNAGRTMGTVIIVVGVGIFGTLTGYLANLFLTPAERRDEDQPADLTKRLTELKQLNDKQQQAISELEELLREK